MNFANVGHHPVSHLAESEMKLNLYVMKRKKREISLAVNWTVGIERTLMRPL